MTSPMYPVKYTGPDVQCANFFVRPRRPTTADFRQPENARLYRLTSVWQVGKNPTDGVEGELWMLSKIVANIATWVMISGGNVGTVVSVTGDDGVVTLPDGGGNIDLIGNTVDNGTHPKPLFVQTGGANTEQWDIQVAAAVAATPGDNLDAGIASFNNAHFTVDPTSGMVSLVDPVDNDLHVARYIVSAGGAADGANYTTIATAYAAAVLAGAPQTVFIQPGIYTENITLTAGINLTAFTADNSTPNVTIIGKITATYTGSASISNIKLQTNGDYCVESTGATASSIFINGCNIAASNNDALHSTNTNAQFQIRNSLFTPTVGFRNFVFTGGNHVFSFNNANGGSITPSTISAGRLILKNSTYQPGITTSGTATLRLVNVQMGDNTTPDNVQMLTVGGSGEHDAVGCLFLSANVATITISSTLTLVNSTVYSNAVNVITGAGTLNRALIAFTGAGSTITTATQNALPTI